MGGVSRTFKLRLSPSGMDVLIAAHCHLIHTTRQLLAWGTTLHTGVMHLDTMPVERIVARFDRIALAALCGAEVHFLGAPATLNDVASRIAARVAAASPSAPAPALLHIYILALKILSSADPADLKLAYRLVSIGGMKQSMKS